jgi:hypothetical protein
LTTDDASVLCPQQSSGNWGAAVRRHRSCRGSLTQQGFTPIQEQVEARNNLNWPALQLPANTLLHFTSLSFRPNHTSLSISADPSKFITVINNTDPRLHILAHTLLEPVRCIY